MHMHATRKDTQEVHSSILWKVIFVFRCNATFLQFLDSIKISLGTKFTVIGVVIYDHSMQLKLQDGRELMLSQQVCSNIYVSS